MEQEERARRAEEAADARLRGVAGAERFSLLPSAASYERELMDLPVYWQTQRALQNPDGTFRYQIDADTGELSGDGTGRYGIDALGRFVDMDA